MKSLVEGVTFFDTSDYCQGYSTGQNIVITKKFSSLCKISYFLRVKVIYCTIYTINCEILGSRYLFFWVWDPWILVLQNTLGKVFSMKFLSVWGFVCVHVYMCVCSCGGGLEVGILIVLSSAGEGNVKIASGGISCKCNMWWIFSLCVFTCTILSFCSFL